MDGALIDRIYEAGAVPELWTDVLDEIGRLVECTGATLLVPTAGRWIASNAVRELVDEFVTSGLAATNERTKRLLGANPPGFVIDQDVFTEEEIVREPVYREFFIPRAGGSGVGTVINAPSGDVIIIHAERPYAQGPVNRKYVEWLDGLRPHLARASLLSARLELERARGAVAALERLGIPAAVLGRTKRIVAANPSLVAMIPQVVQDRLTRITFANPAADHLLAEGLARLESIGVWSIPIPAVDDLPPTIAHLVPVRRSANDVFSLSTAIIMLTPVVPRAVPVAEAIQGLFDLTPTEARIARALSEGRTASEIAGDAGTQAATVRTQIKSILAKTGQRRQADLVGLLRGIPTPPSEG